MNDEMKAQLGDVLKMWLDENCEELDWGVIQAVVDLMVDAVEAVYNTAVTMRSFLMGS